jgi:hypothetical protein
MEGKQQNSGQGLAPELAAAKAAILAECGKLARDGRTMVSFLNQKGDSGFTGYAAERN